MKQLIKSTSVWGIFFIFVLFVGKSALADNDRF
jgi:hypothetical protein